MNKGFTPTPKPQVRSFTLIELIVVIIIVGILAAVGISQYSAMVEKSRGVEARMILGHIRDLAYEYYLQNGTYTGLTNSDVNIGISSDQIPSTSRSTHYFNYTAAAANSTVFWACAHRNTAGGKNPQGSPNMCLCWTHYEDGSGPAGSPYDLHSACEGDGSRSPYW